MTEPTQPAPTSTYGYAHVAWCYDAAAAAYSLGAIGRAKRWHLPRVEPGMRVLYLGTGAGREVALSTARGAEVTCLEPCEAMARRLRDRLSPWADRVTIIGSPLAQATDGGGFDLVCGHFFFNLFDARAMPQALAMAASHVRPGGQLVIADFALPRPATFTRRLLHNAYYRPVNLAGWALGICALHPIYDYGPDIVELGFALEDRVGTGCLPGMLAVYETLCMRKKRGG